MLNQVVLVGRLINKQIEEIDDDKKITIIELAIPRNFKNANGEYDTDYVSITLYGPIANSTNEYCNKGDIIGIKGTIEGYKDKSIRIVAEKVTFLSSRSSRKDEE